MGIQIYAALIVNCQDAHAFRRGEFVPISLLTEHHRKLFYTEHIKHVFTRWKPEIDHLYWWIDSFSFMHGNRSEVNQWNWLDSKDDTSERPSSAVLESWRREMDFEDNIVNSQFRLEVLIRQYRATVEQKH